MKLINRDPAVESMTQWVKYLLCNIRTCGQIPWTCIKKLGIVVLVCNAVLWGEQREADPWGLLSSQSG